MTTTLETNLIDDNNTAATTTIETNIPTVTNCQTKDQAEEENNTTTNNEENDDDDNMSIDSNDSCKNLISLRSIRTKDDLEEAVTFTYPGINRVVRLSTLLEPDDLAPLFAGAQWAGTRVWRAAIRAAHYLATTYPPTTTTTLTNNNKKQTKRKSLLELGCGLGVPGMIYHALGGNVILTDQEEVLSQLEKNVCANFPEGVVVNNEECKDDNNDDDENKEEERATIQALPLNWSRHSLHKLLSSSSSHKKTIQQFDIVLNCDCIYEPLYGKSWMYLSDVIDECLRINPSCIVLTSVERRNGDGVEKFLRRLEEEEEHVGCVEKVWSEGGEGVIEMYLCTGR